MKNLRQRGFTLIELLVVICIISLLASMLMPGLRRSYEMACRAVCANNVKQLAFGTVMYMNDNNDTAPVMAYGAMYNLLGWFSNSKPEYYATANLWTYYSEQDMPTGNNRNAQTMPLFSCPSSGHNNNFNPRTCYA